MHNQDTAKDDFMEAIMEIMNKLAEFYKIGNKEKKTIEEVKKEESLTGENEQEEVIEDERVIRFQKAMKEIIKETDNEQVAMIAQTFHDNPIESMKMLQSIISEQTVESAQKIADNALKTDALLGKVKSSINLDDPRAMDLIATIDALKNEAKDNHMLAENVLKGIRPLGQEVGEEKVQSVVLDKEEFLEQEVISIQEAEELLGVYYNSLDAAEKRDFDEPSLHINENTNNNMILHFESKKGIEPKTKSLILNLEDGTGREVNVSSNTKEMTENDIGNSFKSTTKFTVNDLRQLRDNSNENDSEKEENLEKKNEKSKDREMDGPER